MKTRYGGAPGEVASDAETFGLWNLQSAIIVGWCIAPNRGSTVRVQMLWRAKQRCWSGLGLMGKNPCHIQALVNMQWVRHFITTIAALPELKACFELYRYYLSSILSLISGVFPNICHFRSSSVFDVCVAVHHWYNNINSQLEAKITNFIDIYNQLNMFRRDNFAHPPEH